MHINAGETEQGLRQPLAPLQHRKPRGGETLNCMNVQFSESCPVNLRLTLSASLQQTKISLGLSLLEKDAHSFFQSSAEVSIHRFHCLWHRKTIRHNQNRNEHVEDKE